MGKIGTISEIKKKLSDHNLKIKKQFGQNFLVDQNVLNRIVTGANINKDTIVIEVGPGLGSLTEKLLEEAKHVLAFEIDSELIPILTETFKAESHFTLLHQDILEVDIDEVLTRLFPNETEFVVVSNLPYYITTPILMKFLEKSKKVKRMVMMMQLEVANRIASKPNTKDYNALSIVIQYRADTKVLFKVPRSVFIPEPNVDSAILEITINPDKYEPLEDEDAFYLFVHQCFSQRRKTLVNNLKNAYPEMEKLDIENILSNSSIPATIRAEALPIEKFIELFKNFK